MADPITIAAIVSAAASATSSLMATGQARQVGAAQARALEVEAGAARTQAGMEAEALAGQQRRQFGELRAAGAQAGLTESVTFGDVYRQAAAAAELDRSLVEYQGETQALGLLTEARITRASRPSWAQGILQAGAAGLGGYTAAGGRLPTGGGRGTGLAPRTSGPTAMTRRYTPPLPTGPRYG